MFSKNTLKLSVAVLLSVGMSACTGGTSGMEGSTGTEARQPASDNYISGTAISKATVADMHITSEGGTIEEVLTRFPELSVRVDELNSVTDLVETSEGHLELYENGSLVMALAANGNLKSIISSRKAFAAESITMTTVPGEKPKSSLSFVLTGCESRPAPAESAQVCSRLVVTLELATIVLPPEQDQDQKDEDKSEDKQDQDQKDQDKSEDKQDQDQKDEDKSEDKQDQDQKDEDKSEDKQDQDQKDEDKSEDKQDQDQK